VARDVTGFVRNHQPADPQHARHDHLLVASFASGDATPAEQDRARALIASCAECAALADDIGAIINQTRRLPAIQRTRDFRLTAEQAGRLRGSFLQRVMEALAGPGWAVLRPLAAVTASVGLVLAVVGTWSPAMVAPVGLAPRAAASAAGPAESFADVQPVAAPSGNAAAGASIAPPPAPPSAGVLPGDAGGRSIEPTSGTQVPNENMATTTTAPPSIVIAPDQSPPPPIATPVATGSAEAVPSPETQATKSGDQAFIASSAPSNPPVAEAPTPAMEAPASAGGGRALLIYGGLGLAILSLAALAIVWLLRRRLGDPLLR
jgi:hypothetical protein